MAKEVDVRNMDAHLAQLRRDCASTAIELHRQLKEIESLEKERKESEAANRTALASIAEERARLAGERSESEVHRKNAHALLAQLKERSEMLIEEVKRLEARKTTVAVDIERLEETIQKRAKEKHELVSWHEKERPKLENELAALVEKVETTRREKDAIKNDMKGTAGELRGDVRTLELKKSELSSEVGDLEKKNERLANEHFTLTNEVEDKKKELLDVEEQQEESIRNVRMTHGTTTH